MFLFHKNLVIKENEISFKKSQNYSKDFTFIPMKYKGKEILIQTPYCFIPYNLKQYTSISKHKYLDISFQENNKEFINNLLIFYDTTHSKFSKRYQIEPFLKESQYSKWMRFKIDKDCLFFNQYKQKINSFDSKIFGIFIIQLSGLWIMDQKMWFSWKILQAKLNIPIHLKEYAFIDEKEIDSDQSPPPPQPPPPPPPPPPLPPQCKYTQMIKLGIPKHAVEQRKKMDCIQASELKKITLKKTNVKKNKKITNRFTPCLEEIRTALQCLQKIQ